jgi:oxygen-independent coproporphyrinogen-3 oxidase
LYQLTIEDGTAFGDRLKIGRLPGLPSDDKSADMYNITQDIMADHGLPQYEISNHASLGEEAQHNLIYWRSGDYIGIGPGAHGRYHTNKQRLATVKTKEPNSWLTKVKKLGNGEESSSVLTKSDQALEYLLMSARLSEGVDLNFIKSLDLHIIDQDKLKSLIESGYIFTSKDRMFVTPSGRTVLNTILSEIIS